RSAPSEFVTFGFVVSNSSLKCSALPFPISDVSLPAVDLAKQAAINHRTTAVVTQSGALVAQLVPALS
ncbi:MAG TPA: hypothetical protein VIJ87_07775, partial [Pyrinomonadaceae bacterium]